MDSTTFEQSAAAMDLERERQEWLAISAEIRNATRQLVEHAQVIQTQALQRVMALGPEKMSFRDALDYMVVGIEQERRARAMLLPRDRTADVGSYDGDGDVPPLQLCARVKACLLAAEAGAAAAEEPPPPRVRPAITPRRRRGSAGSPPLSPTLLADPHHSSYLPLGPAAWLRC
jgi:hypothetical protein